MLNQVVLIGRLVRDPELRYTQSGKAVANLTLAVDRGGSSGGSSKDNNADFIDCVLWERSAEAAANHLSKGRLIAFTGQIRTRAYEGQDGSRRKVTEVHGTFRFLPDGMNRKGQANQPNQPNQPNQANQPQASADEGFYFDDDEDVPF